jgi:hypothetical protein
MALTRQRFSAYTSGPLAQIFTLDYELALPPLLIRFYHDKKPFNDLPGNGTAHQLSLILKHMTRFLSIL